MPKKTRAEFETLLAGISDADRADLFSLFDDITERDKRIETMSKEKLDADQIVSRSATLQKERDDLAKQKGELELKLSEITGKPADEIELSAFAPFFNLFG